MVIDDIFPAMGNTRVTTTIHENTGLPSLQMEMNTKYFDPAHKEFNPEPFMRALEATAQYC